MNINYKSFKPLNNYVLLLPDPALESYQLKGRETNIISPDYKYEGGKIINVKERNASTTGTIYAVCDEITFYLNEIKHLRNSYTTHRKFNIDGTLKNVCINTPIQRLIDTWYRSSNMYHTTVEVHKGDRVNFSFMAHEKCRQEGKVVQTELGEMYLMKYDQLYYTISENQEPIKMLNGYIVVEPEEIETEKFEIKEGWQVDGIQTQTGIVIPNPKKLKKKRKIQLGTVRYFGSPNKGYLQEPDAKDHNGSLETGMKILYDPRGATTMEYENHQAFSSKQLMILHRKDILLIDKEIELNLISFV